MSSSPDAWVMLRAIACPPMKKCVSQILCFAAVCQLLGGHWAILQTAAWVGMVIEYSANDGLQAGLSKTFDGAHPCELCKSIAKNKGAEKKHAAPFESGKLIVLSQAYTSVLHYHPTQFWRLRPSLESAHSLCRTPPVPPPRIQIG
jgi:hypothetical protein